MPPPALTSNCDASDAFHDQFSEIIRHEARLRGDNSEDAMGPGRKHWVEKHLKEVAQAQAQRRPSQLPSQASTLNEHAQVFVSPLSAQKTTPVHSGQKTTPVHSGQITPWYESFNLADQGVLYGSGLYQSPGSNTKSLNPALAQSPNRPYNSFGSNAESHNLAFAQSPNRSYNSPGPNTAFQNRANGQSPYRPFDPAEVAAYRAAVQAQLSQSSTQRAEQQPIAPSEHHYPYNSDLIYQTIQDDPRSQFPSAHLNANAYTRYPSTPPNLPATYPYQTPSVDSLSDITTNLSLHASTEPITRSAGMSSLIAPDNYISFELLAFEVTVGDYIQSVQYPGTYFHKTFITNSSVFTLFLLCSHFDTVFSQIISTNSNHPRQAKCYPSTPLQSTIRSPPANVLSTQTTICVSSGKAQTGRSVPKCSTGVITFTFYVIQFPFYVRRSSRRRRRRPPRRRRVRPGRRTQRRTARTRGRRITKWHMSDGIKTRFCMRAAG